MNSGYTDGGYDQQAASDWGDQVSDASAEGLFEMSTADVDETKIGSKVTVDKAGKYHFDIVDAKNDFEIMKQNGDERSPCVLVTMEVVATSPNQSPVGSIHWHRVDVAGKGGGPLEDWQLSSSVNFLYGIGLLRKEVVQGPSGEEVKFIDPATGKVNIDVKTLAERIKGLQCIGDIKKETDRSGRYDDRYVFPFGRGCFRVDDPAVADVTKNPDSLAVRKPYPAGEKAKGGNGDTNGPGPAANPSQPNPGTPPAGHQQAAATQQAMQATQQATQAPTTTPQAAPTNQPVEAVAATAAPANGQFGPDDL